ncbi:MAG: hypothetical protein OEM28_02580 [Nitrosopumilus sp.]|nr:hypothetical protein [Nitrosopumilus sp.]MDH3486994.1 hypothetical protein [Nitrosopumilus sp.]
MKYSERNKSFISFTLNKKLVLLVMIVTVIALGIASYMNFDYAPSIPIFLIASTTCFETSL